MNHMVEVILLKKLIKKLSILLKEDILLSSKALSVASILRKGDLSMI